MEQNPHIKYASLVSNHIYKHGRLAKDDNEPIDELTLLDSMACCGLDFKRSIEPLDRHCVRELAEDLSDEEIMYSGPRTIARALTEALTHHKLVLVNGGGESSAAYFDALR